MERPTKDIDLLIEASGDNLERVKRALAVLPDNLMWNIGATPRQAAAGQSARLSAIA